MIIAVEIESIFLNITRVQARRDKTLGERETRQDAGGKQDKTRNRGQAKQDETPEASKARRDAGARLHNMRRQVQVRRDETPEVSETRRGNKIYLPKYYLITITIHPFGYCVRVSSSALPLFCASYSKCIGSQKS